MSNSIFIPSGKGTKALNGVESTSDPQLITRRSKVQILPPQPEIRWNRTIPADYFCFSALLRLLNFGRFFLTQILTHTGLRSVQDRSVPERTFPIVWAVCLWAALVTWA